MSNYTKEYLRSVWEQCWFFFLTLGLSLPMITLIVLFDTLGFFIWFFGLLFTGFGLVVYQVHKTAKQQAKNRVEGKK